MLIDNAAGDCTTDTIYDDANADQIESLPDTQLHRNVDLELLKADKEGASQLFSVPIILSLSGYLSGYVKVYLILPSTIYGIASGVLVDAGIQNPHSKQVPGLIMIALSRGRAGMVGAGKNVWPNVDIEEGKKKHDYYSGVAMLIIYYLVADLYIVLYDSIITNPATGHGREGFYFGENGEHTLYDVGKAIGEALVAIGKTDNPEPTTLTKEEIDRYFQVSNHIIQDLYQSKSDHDAQGSTLMGTNCRAVANRSRSIGWKPVKTTKDLLASVKPEVVALIQRSEKAQKA